MVASRRAKEGEETVQLVKKAGSDGIFVKTDVANEDDVRLLVEKTIKKYGRLDYVFNNAAIGEKMTPLVEQTSDVFDQIMNVNVKGVWLCMKYEISQMLKETIGDNHQFLETFKSMHPIGRIGDPEEIANAVAWLLSDKASFVLGHTLLVDGDIVSQ